MIDLEHVRLWAPIGTAEDWLPTALADLGLEKPSRMATISTVLNAAPGTQRVAVVRHPVDWLENIFELLTTPHHDFYSVMVPELAGLRRGSVFEFVQDYIAKCPGAVGRFFFRSEYDSAIRYEDLPAALYLTLEAMGISVERSRWALKKPTPHLRKMDRQWQRVIVNYEREFSERYEYF